ncbi:MAG TPA: site-2 protease family protein [Pirellulales bacterium]
MRISPWFWLANALLGWSFASQIAVGSRGAVTAGAALLIWIVAVLVSIVIHEMGHALAYRHYGVASHIVLYHFGGLAIADQSYDNLGDRRIHHPKRQIVISLAGPLTEMIVGIALIAILFVGGYGIDNPIPQISQLDFLEDGKPLPSIALIALVDAFIYCSVWWALMNLLPVYPLDGGRVSRELFTLSNAREGIRSSLMLSIAAGAAVAIWALSQHQTFLALMFGGLAYSSFVTLQAYMGRGGGFGGGAW